VRKTLDRAEKNSQVFGMAKKERKGEKNTRQRVPHSRKTKWKKTERTQQGKPINPQGRPEGKEKILPAKLNLKRKEANRQKSKGKTSLGKRGLAIS